jgi:hypothetical protein
MARLDNKQSNSTPENWEKFRPETLLFATEVCMMNRDTRVIGADNSGFGALAGAVIGFVIVLMLLGLFQAIDNIQTPNQITYRNLNPWKFNRIKPITDVSIGPATPAVVAAPPPPVVSAPPSEPKPPVEIAKAEEATKAESAAKAEEVAKAEAAAKVEEAAKAEAAAKAEEAAKAEAAAKAEEAAKAEAAAKAEEAAKAEAAAKAEETSAAENHEANVLNAITTWADAWSTQKIDAYISSYSSDFKPKQYKSREYWEEQRRKRLSKPSSIHIQLSNIQISLTEDGNATATFVQIYKSPSFTDQVRKTLVLKQESGTWKISSETAKPL